jgi:hypothetical protein
VTVPAYEFTVNEYECTKTADTEVKEIHMLHMKFHSMM